MTNAKLKRYSARFGSCTILLRLIRDKDSFSDSIAGQVSDHSDVELDSSFSSPDREFSG